MDKKEAEEVAGYFSVFADVSKKQEENYVKKD